MEMLLEIARRCNIDVAVIPCPSIQPPNRANHPSNKTDKRLLIKG